jgi:putative hydrolase of the HAD superfamily
MIQTIVFDFGKVIGFFDHRRATDFLVHHTDLTADAMLAAMIGGELEDDYESGRISSDEFVRIARRACRLRCSEEDFKRVFADIFWPNPDVCALIPRLRSRYRLILGSNTTELHALHFKRQFAEVFRHFDHLVLSFEIGVRKPKAGFFEHCQRLAGTPPSACLFIDDLPANVEGARACGWHGIVYRGGDLRGQLAAFGIRTDEESAA